MDKFYSMDLGNNEVETNYEMCSFHATGGGRWVGRNSFFAVYVPNFAKLSMQAQERSQFATQFSIW